MGSFVQAIEYAHPIWQEAIFNLGWGHGLVASAYGVAAWLGFLNARVARQTQGDCSIWCGAALLMCLLGANTVLQGDVFATQLFRALSRLQGWYGHRREFQYAAIGLIALIALSLGFWIFQRFETYAQIHSGSVSAGLIALLLLLAVRTVSAHGTDAVMNSRYLGLSVGRLFELAGIGWVMWGALRNLHLPWVNPETYQTGKGHHV